MDARVVRFFYNTYIAPLVENPRTCMCAELTCTCRMDEKPMKEFLDSIGLENVYMGGFFGLVIELVEPNERFQISEYDGAESVDYYRDEDWYFS